MLLPSLVRRAEASQTLTTPTALCAATPPQEGNNILDSSSENQQYATRDRQYLTKIRDIPINGVGMRTTQNPEAIYGDIA